MVPFYNSEEPSQIMISERLVEGRTERFEVPRLEVYEADENYELAKSLKSDPNLLELIRLGSISGSWRSYPELVEFGKFRRTPR